MLSALVVLASEKDPLAELSNISDISRLAASSHRFAQSALAIDLYARTQGAICRRGSTPAGKMATPSGSS